MARASSPVTNLSRKTKAIWNILSQNGLSSNVVGWWPSHPAEPIRGAMVSNHFQRAVGPPENPWPVLPGAVYPPELSDTLAALRLNPNELLAEHILPFVPRAAEIDQQEDRRLAACGQILAECTSVNAVATWLMANRPWDFMAVYFDAIDHFCHGFMRYHPPRQEHVSELDFELYRNVIEAGYRYHDMMLHTLVQMAGPETTVILMSDHGFHADHLRPKQIPAEPAGPAFEHRDFGIFVMAGPGVRHDTLLHGLGLLDITPTLLTLFGLPVGDDMDGRAIVEAFEDPPPSATIPSWDDVPGDAGLHPADLQLDPVESNAALEQLVALGYIEPPPADRQQAIDNTVRELRYNLARSYMDDGQHGAAAEILDELYDRWPNEHRFGVQLAYCFSGARANRRLAFRGRGLGHATKNRLRSWPRSELRELVQATARRATTTEETKEGPPVPATTSGENCSSCVGVQRMIPARSSIFGVAWRWPKVTTKRRSPTWNARRGPACDRPALYLQIGEAYLRLRQPDQAERNFRRAASVDPDHPHSHLGLARVHLQRHEDEAAARAALQALGLRYQLPMAHFLLGVALYRLGSTLRPSMRCTTALAINPHYPEAHRLTGDCLSTPLGRSRAGRRAPRIGPRNARRPPLGSRSAKQQFCRQEIRTKSHESPAATISRTAPSTIRRKLRDFGRSRGWRLMDHHRQRLAAKWNVVGDADACGRRSGDSFRRPPRGRRA